MKSIPLSALRGRGGDARPRGRRNQVFEFIRTRHERTGIFPSVNEISHHFGWRSPFSAQRHIEALEKAKALKRIPGITRGFKINPKFS